MPRLSNWYSVDTTTVLIELHASVFFLLRIWGRDDSTFGDKDAVYHYNEHEEKDLHSFWVSGWASMAIAIRILSCYGESETDQITLTDN